MSGIHPRERYSLENRRRLLGLLSRATSPAQDRPFSLLHSLFPIHQAFVTVIQIPIVIYVDINGNPSSCRCSSALVLLLLHPSPLPLRTIERTPSSLPPSLLLVQTLCFIESELSPLLLPSRHHPSTHPSLHPRITRFFDLFSFSFSFRLPDRPSWGGGCPTSTGISMNFINKTT